MSVENHRSDHLAAGRNQDRNQGLRRPRVPAGQQVAGGGAGPAASGTADGGIPCRSHPSATSAISSLTRRSERSRVFSSGPVLRAYSIRTRRTLPFGRRLRPCRFFTAPVLKTFSNRALSPIPGEPQDACPATFRIHRRLLHGHLDRITRARGCPRRDRPALPRRRLAAGRMGHQRRLTSSRRHGRRRLIHFRPTGRHPGDQRPGSA